MEINITVTARKEVLQLGQGMQLIKVSWTDSDGAMFTCSMTLTKDNTREHEKLHLEQIEFFIKNSILISLCNADMQTALREKISRLKGIESTERFELESQLQRLEKMGDNISVYYYEGDLNG